MNCSEVTLVALTAKAGYALDRNKPTKTLVRDINDLGHRAISPWFEVK